MCQRRYMWHQMVLVCLLASPVVVAMTSTIIGYLTLTEDGQVTEPLVPVVRLVVGSLQFLVAAFAVLAVLLAALGVKPGGKQFLLVYTVLMVLFMLVQLSFTSVFLGLVYAPQQIEADTRNQLNQSLHSEDIDVIDRLQMDYQCCGVDGYQDWKHTNWSMHNSGLLAPLSCCKNDLSDNCSKVVDNLYVEGCLDSVMTLIYTSALRVAIATAPLLLIEGFMAIISGHLYRTLVRYSKYNVL